MLNYLEPDEGYNREELGPDHTAARDNAILWARRILETEFVVLDTETTGLDPDDEAVSIGLVSKSGEVLLDTILKHEKPCNPKALATHGVTWEQTRTAPLIDEIYADLESIFVAPVVGYNATFDQRILRQTTKRHGLHALDLKLSGDVMQKFAEFYGDWNDYYESYRWQKLTFAARYFGIETERAHGAAADCLMTLGVIRAMARSPLSTEIQEQSWLDVPPERIQREYDHD